MSQNDDLISRQAAIDLLKQMRKDGDMVPWEGKDVFARIRKLPSAQPERENGHWIYYNDGKDEYYKCSECGDAFALIGGSPEENDYNFCPNCGADMRGKQNEDA